MDVSSPISSVIPSLDGPVYSALSSTNGPMALGAYTDSRKGPPRAASGPYCFEWSLRDL